MARTTTVYADDLHSALELAPWAGWVIPAEENESGLPGWACHEYLPSQRPDEVGDWMHDDTAGVWVWMGGE